MSDVIMNVLEEVADMEINLGSETARKYLAEKIKSAIDNADKDDRMELLGWLGVLGDVRFTTPWSGWPNPSRYGCLWLTGENNEDCR